MTTRRNFWLILFKGLSADPFLAGFSIATALNSFDEIVIDYRSVVIAVNMCLGHLAPKNSFELSTCFLFK